MTAASGTLIRNTQRHEIVCTMTPPSGGPPTVARLVSDVQRPIARPASPAQVTRSSARLVVVQHRAAHSLQRPAADQHGLARRERREQRRQREEDDADDERAAEADAVADRAADEVEGRERERVGEVDPLLAAEAEPEVLLHLRQRHDHDRRVEERERRAERRREQRQHLHAAGRVHLRTLSAGCNAAASSRDGRRVTAHTGPWQLPSETKGMQTMAFEELTSRQAVMWGSAPFENVADLISEMHEALVERLAPRPGEQWLDLGCGAGDVAFLAARAGAIVTGSDLSPDARRSGATPRRRARPRPRRSRWPTARTSPTPMRRSTSSSSSVGVIFAPDHARVAHELARVCRPGGRLGLTAWRKSSGVGEMFAMMAPYMPPPPPGVGSAVPVGRRGATSSRCSATPSSSPSRSSTPAMTGDDGARDVGVLPRQLRPFVHALVVARRRAAAQLDEDMTAYFESYRDGRRDQRRAPLHRHHGRAQGLGSPGVHSSSR